MQHPSEGARACFGKKLRLFHCDFSPFFGKEFVIAPRTMKLTALLKLAKSSSVTTTREKALPRYKCFCHFRVNPNSDCEAQLRGFEAKCSNTETNPE